MGYDVTVIKTNYHRWFSIWNWHRCLVLTLYGMDVFDDEVFTNKMMQVSDLQNLELPKTQEEEDKFLVKKTKKDESPEERRVIQHNMERDDDGYIIGGAIILPLGPKEKFDERMERAMMSSLQIQAATSEILLDNKDTIGLTKDECITLASMDGTEIKDEHSMRLYMGCLIGMIRASVGKIPEDRAVEMLKLTKDLLRLDHPVIQKTEEGRRKSKEMDKVLTRMFNKAREHKPDFEIDELWDPDELVAVGKFIGLMAESVNAFSPIRID